MAERKQDSKTGSPDQGHGQGQGPGVDAGTAEDKALPKKRLLERAKPIGQSHKSARTPIGRKH